MAKASLAATDSETPAPVPVAATAPTSATTQDAYVAKVLEERAQVVDEAATNAARFSKDFAGAVRAGSVNPAVVSDLLAKAQASPDKEHGGRLLISLGDGRSFLQDEAAKKTS